MISAWTFFSSSSSADTESSVVTALIKVGRTRVIIACWAAGVPVVIPRSTTSRAL